MNVEKAFPPTQRYIRLQILPKLTCALVWSLANELSLGNCFVFWPHFATGRKNPRLSL